MPGAQPRRQFQQRMASTARRGSYTPAGVPGVYRVPRTRTVVTQAADPGRATFANPWIQPDDESDTFDFSEMLVSQYGTGEPGSDLNDWFMYGPDPNISTGVFGGENWRWETVIIALTRDDFAGSTMMSSFDPGTPPPGFSGFEVEADYGRVLRAKVGGRLFTSDFNVADTGSYQVREITPSTLNPGVEGAYTTRIGPTRAWSGTTVHTTVGTATPDTFDTPYQEWDEADERLGWQVAELHAFGESTFVGTSSGSGAYNMNVSGVDSGAAGAVRVTFDWRPARYRWV